MSEARAERQKHAETIRRGEAILGFELGSTRIKATLVGPDLRPMASGSHGWENRLREGVWTYAMEDVWTGMAGCFADLKRDVQERYGVSLTRVAAAGFSGMMHGYIAVDHAGELLVPFRTWRNNITGEAVDRLTDLFRFAVPQRWSIAHLYQAILNEEEHVPQLRRVATLSAYVQWKLTGTWAIGTCEASGMFPVDPETGDYDSGMIAAFDRTVADRGYPWKVADLLPPIVPVDRVAGTLTPEGARILDPSGELESGIPLAPPEGDAGTGMVATNSVRPRTGNASAGTSAFAMVVLEQKLTEVHREIDIILTPDGKSVAMAHSNNCTSDFDAWISLFGEVAQTLGLELPAEELYGRLMPLALEGDADAGGLLTYGYVSGEHVTGFTEGRPLVVRKPDGNFSIRNFIRAQLFSALGALRTGLDILTEEESVGVDEIRGHGGFFKTPEVGQRIMAAATNTPVSVLDTAGEGGAWGMALLAAYMDRRVGSDGTAESLPDFLDGIFAGSSSSAVEPNPEDSAGFDAYFRRYTEGLAIERAAVDHLP